MLNKEQIMMKEKNKKKFNGLMELIRKFLDKKIIATEFSHTYENMFLENLDRLSKKLPPEIVDLLDDINLAIGYFEPNEEIRKEYSGYLDEKQLRVKIEEAYQKMEKILKGDAKC